ncbi:heat-inducible transcriptional repressor HrcA [Clostridium sp. CF011]|uniref:heat-inducible transcriptional repressor HrcA n=1 Tax=unclassified Clostridium TaxID=2614128 RepID=UPI001C0B8D29|nr:MULTISPECIES: heat-inducible transcriptional repressor HrcA [unclassified Clostridium]MBU3090714.1 heat-inducible transcriptional repressor HrcA [Clostridium sp. CF011]MBW9144292.1 heat-inducible transcriptional repressor HrcA [Clostridium sp. CM027]UVE41074.1 heat-inducible transcriptional repressor HrcA [Clostridium sp. CM027]WAG70065.1 heat-inducible transcriptional repressor HrcA [Clostridium sp. CF011]
MEMDERKIKILQAIITDYINNGEPVGSRTIAKKYDLGISPATIRNEMSDLEELGYIEQLHTSSGRKPSDKGYRLYVDRLMELTKLSNEEEYMIKNHLINAALYEVDKIVKQATQMLSLLTNLTSIVKAPSVQKSCIKYIQLMNLDAESILFVIITDSGIIKNNVIKIRKPIGSDSIAKLNNMLNFRLRKLTIEQINLEVINNLKRDLAFYQEIFDGIIPALYDSLSGVETSEVYIQGAANIFNYPEYNNITKAREFLVLVDNKESINSLLGVGDITGNITIKIGEENFVECARECSIITAVYSASGIPLGSIGVIGPTRIPYGKVISVLTGIVKELNDNIAQIYDDHR